MVSLGRSAGITLLSLSRSASSLLLFKTRTFSVPSSRRNFFWTTTGFFATALCLPSSASPLTASNLGSISQLESRQSPTRLSMSSDSTTTFTQDMATGYLNAADAAALDGELMSTPGFSLEQLMELAGLAVAEAVYQVVPPSNQGIGRSRILLICGPGNNGGDGLVAARHLVFFGYDCVVVYPKRSSKQHFINLVKQCEDVGVTIVDALPDDFTQSTEGGEAQYSAIVDAIFGFSFKGAPREPFATALTQMKQASTIQGIPVISVDVPSGWNVDEGDVAKTGFMPDVLISLTTPKLSSKGFPGRHFVGGRFLPPALAEKYKVQMPPYPGVSQVMEVTNLTSGAESSKGTSATWEQEYAEYLREKQASEQLDSSSSLSKINAMNNKLEKNESEDEKEGRNNNLDESASTWEAEYAAYCAEKEALLAVDDARRIQELKLEQQQRQ